MCCRGIEMLNVLLNSRERCEGDDRECEPSIVSSTPVQSAEAVGQ